MIHLKTSKNNIHFALLLSAFLMKQRCFCLSVSQVLMMEQGMRQDWQIGWHAKPTKKRATREGSSFSCLRA